jgi:polyisoprenoid-binding protein YceI
MAMRAFLASLAVFFALALAFPLPAAAARIFSYYAPPENMSAGMLIDYSKAYSQDYINLNPNPKIMFGRSTAAFRFNRDTKSIGNLRISITVGSLDSGDNDFNWLMLGKDALDVNANEEITLIARDEGAFDKDGKASFTGLLTLHGLTRSVNIDAVLQFIEDGNPIAGIFSGEKGALGLALKIDFRAEDFGMRLDDSENRSRGDLASLRFQMRAIRQ